MCEAIEMGWNPHELIEIKEQLNTALELFNWSEVEKICEHLVDRIYCNTDQFPLDDAKEIMSGLRRKERFKLMALFAEALIRTQQNAPQIRRQYAQAMIDQGFLTAPEFILTSIVADTETNETEKAEALGLIGRIYKQLYVNNDAKAHYSRYNLNKALEYYWSVYQDNPQKHIWHGINVVALMQRAKQDNVPIQVQIDKSSTVIASDIIETINQREANLPDPSELSIWDVATKMEASIAINQHEEALLLANRYTALRARTDAFELNSTLRQLIELWRLKDDEFPGKWILTIIRAALLRKRGGIVTLSAQEVRTEPVILEELEARFGGAQGITYASYKQGLERCESVARIERLDGQGHGTGWLTDAGYFFPDKAGKRIVVTNAHVISPNYYPGALFPNQAQVRFEVKNEIFNIKNIMWSSPVGEFDATFLELDESEKVPSAKLLKVSDNTVEFRQPPPRLFIIGHPLGGGLQFSLEDNLLLAANSKYLHYRTLTEKGSSGSPVFNDNGWEVVALHHAGSKTMKRLDNPSETYEANEGISVQAIKQDTLSQNPSHGY